MRENITAEWAKETAQTLLNAKIKSQISKILDDIELAVKKNDFRCTSYGDFHDLAIEDIEKRGFIVKINANINQMDGVSYSISW